MIIADLAEIAGRRYPARRRTQNVVGGVSPIQARNFALGHVTLDPDGGQVPWHNQEQEEVYFVLEGTGEILSSGCVIAAVKRDVGVDQADEGLALLETTEGLERRVGGLDAFVGQAGAGRLEDGGLPEEPRDPTRGARRREPRDCC